MRRAACILSWIALTAACAPPAHPVDLPVDLPGVDGAVKAFMAKYNVPGLSLAITKDEKLVYLKAYGKADDTHAATPQNLFRLASVSKQITSIAIMRLLDQGKISLDQRVFGAGAILGTEYGTAPYGQNITNITVDQLLHHTSGGWQNDGTDPMFTNPTMTASQLISWTLDNRPLNNVPGTSYAYSNFGYCVLGRVIEKITGKPYAAAVKALVLQPLGISDMSISGNTLADRKPNEVQYYGQGGENPYAYNIERMDSHGGWLATAADLAKILVRVDGFPDKADILKPSTILAMTTGTAANSGYACGWLVNPVGNWWHQGSLPGTATEIARTVGRGRYNFVILINTRNPNPAFSADLDRLFWVAEAGVTSWPAVDLF
jgi:D-alanyl-D-alanine carboxypeptidase